MRCEAVVHGKACLLHVCPQRRAEFRKRLQPLAATQDKGMAAIMPLEAAGPVEAHREAAVPQPVADGFGASDIRADRSNVMNRIQGVVQAFWCDEPSAQAMRAPEP